MLDLLMTKKIALITGISGQDGAYLAKFLLKKNYKIIGLTRTTSKNNNWRLKKLNI
jgi:GDP-D-mannose dehydratase